MAKSQSRYWPSVDDLDGAKEAAHQGAQAAAIVAGVTALFSVLAIFGIRILPGFSPLSLVDASIFAIVAWRIFKMSMVWAVVGLLLFAGERAYAFYYRGAAAMAGIIVGIILLLGFVNGVRGTFAHHSLAMKAETIESNTNQV
jgi:hypothetical protein